MKDRFLVLIVDDMPQYAEALASVLTNRTVNIQCVIAHTAEEALEAINTRGDFDAAICDINLQSRVPGDRSGMGVISYINSKSPQTRIIVLSGYLTMEIIHQLYQLQGVSRVIAKDDVLPGALSELLGAELKKRELGPKLTSEPKHKFPEMQEISDSTVELLENFLIGFLHSLSNYVLDARINAEIIAELVKVEKGTDARALRALDRLEQSLKRISLISERLRNAMGRIPCNFRPVDLNELIRDVISHSEYKGSKQLILELDEALPKIEGDRELLWLLIENLVTNAFESFDRPDAAVSLATRANQAEGTVNLAVSDTGRGIPPENVARIFQPFYTTKPTGLGLGLFLVNKSVRFHGGSIICESKPGEGTTFSIALPIRRNMR